MSSDKTTYKAAGVDIDKANALVDDIKRIAQRTHRPGILTGIGGFGAMFEIPDHYQSPVLVSGTDGVGTKLKLALELNQHDTIGIDLVAMCANDILCCGADPLFFLDYYATGKLNTDQARDVLSGIGQGCEQAGCALIGGETAEMPGMYEGDDYDLAGFCVGAVNKTDIIDGQRTIQVGDAIIGLASSGPHANGFSLIRYLINQHKIDLTSDIAGKPLSQHLMAPTRMYVKSIQALKPHVRIHGLAHITGGGLTDNIPRIMPPNSIASLNYSDEEWPAFFQWLKAIGDIDFDEMVKSFNVGIGMIIILPADQANRAVEILNAAGEKTGIIGQINASDNTSPSVCFQ